MPYWSSFVHVRLVLVRAALDQQRFERHGVYCELPALHVLCLSVAREPEVPVSRLVVWRHRFCQRLSVDLTVPICHPIPIGGANGSNSAIVLRPAAAPMRAAPRGGWTRARSRRLPLRR